jgi:hypothetical protein
MTSWASLVLATPSERPIAGSAGSMLSMAMAMLAVMMAIVTTNSPKPMPIRLEPWFS